MATFEAPPSFFRKYEALTVASKERFRQAFRELRDGLPPKTDRPEFPNGLRVKGVKGTNNQVFEMSYEPDGRALFQFGEPIRPGHAHIQWLIIGTHADVF